MLELLNDGNMKNMYGYIYRKWCVWGNELEVKVGSVLVSK